MVDRFELRLGNWVMVDGRIEIVMDILLTGINLDNNGEPQHRYEILQPISINEQILLHFKFSTVDNNWFERNFDDGTKIRYNYLSRVFEYNQFGSLESVALWRDLYLHQFQNLVFVLANKVI